MNRRRVFIASTLLVVFASTSGQETFRASERPQEERSTVDLDFFDVLEMPARIDGLRLEADGKEISLTCAVANRQGEELLGLRLILMAFDETGKYRGRISWTERDPLAGYSIMKATFHPPGLRIRRAGDRFVLGIDEVIGRETIWRASGIEKALRAYARGQHDVLPEIRTMPNKFDSRPNQLPVIRLRQYR